MSALVGFAQPYPLNVPQDESFDPRPITTASRGLSDRTDRAAFEVLAAEGPSISLIQSRLMSLLEQAIALTRREGDNGQLRDIALSMNRLIDEYLEASKSSPQPASRSSTGITDYMRVHDLRAPLNNIFLLLDTPLDERDPNFYKDLLACYDLILPKVRNLPVHSGQDAEAGLHLAPISLADVCNNIRTQISSFAKRYGVAIDFNISHFFDHNVIGDQHQIENILMNFISNAIKYSGSRTIDVFIEFDRDQVLFRVVDYGKGISLEDQQRLFKPFSQLQDDSCCCPWFRSKSVVSSSGVGLASCERTAIWMNHGRRDVIGVRSDGRHGAEFWFVIPYTKARIAALEPTLAVSDTSTQPTPIPVPALPASTELARDNLRILIADDTALTLALYSRTICPKGRVSNTSVVLCGSGEDAIDQYQIKLANGEPPDVVILDMHMLKEGLTGVQTAQRIQEIAFRALSRLPHFIFCSGNPEDVQVALTEFHLEASYSIISKPLRRNDLFGAINRAVS
jgi:signal transduction histidine kinase/CheY-like chemotaxis protein